MKVVCIGAGNVATHLTKALFDAGYLIEQVVSRTEEHGQNHGLWLLNTPAEMEKVRNTVPRIFDSIKDRRPWVFIGYSGEDPIFEHIQKLGRFDNGLYWVSYNDNKPNEKVQQFLSDPNTNTFLIKGYDSDSFMLKLNNELGLGQPSIVDKPFTSLKEMLNGIVDIEDKEYFKGVKERLTISKNQVEKAIGQFELGETESSHVAGRLDKILHNKKIPRETHRLHYIQFEFNPFQSIRLYRITVTFFRAFKCKLTQIIRFKLDTNHFIVSAQLIETIAKLLPQFFFWKLFAISRFRAKAFRNREHRHQRVRIDIVRFDLGRNLYRIL